MTLNDENSRASVTRAHDQVSTFFSHFSRPDATWESFGKADTYVEFLKLHLTELLHCVEAELQTRNTVEPTEFGS